MIFAEWIHYPHVKTILRVPVDRYWGKNTPLPGDEVTTIDRYGTITYTLGPFIHKTKGYWDFHVGKRGKRVWFEVEEAPKRCRNCESRGNFDCPHI